MAATTPVLHSRFCHPLLLASCFSGSLGLQVDALSLGSHHLAHVSGVTPQSHVSALALLLKATTNCPFWGLWLPCIVADAAGNPLLVLGWYQPLAVLNLPEEPGLPIDAGTHAHSTSMLGAAAPQCQASMSLLAAAGNMAAPPLNL